MEKGITLAHFCCCFHKEIQYLRLNNLHGKVIYLAHTFVDLEIWYRHWQVSYGRSHHNGGNIDKT